MVSFKKGEIMKSFNEWLKERKNIEENIADYTPGFIRKPLQNMGLMGNTTADKKRFQQKRLERERQEAIAAHNAAEKKDYQRHLDQMSNNREKMKRDSEAKAKADANRRARKGVRHPYGSGTWHVGGAGHYPT